MIVIDSYCYRILSSLTAVRCFSNGFVGKQPVALKEYCVEYWLEKEHRESMDRCTACSAIAEILLKMELNTMQSISYQKTKFRLSNLKTKIEENKIKIARQEFVFKRVE